ncbi:MAG: hypothetical protein ACR2HG_15550 [Pyrinomonadaceae bacterium]
MHYKRLRRLKEILLNKYRDNPTKLAAWTSASHVERAAKKKTQILPTQ